MVLQKLKDALGAIKTRHSTPHIQQGEMDTLMQVTSIYNDSPSFSEIILLDTRTPLGRGVYPPCYNQTYVSML